MVAAPAENTLRCARHPGSGSPSRVAAGGTLRDVTRSCARPGCSRTAVATLSYEYARGLVVLDDLADDPHPMVHDLCGSHAEGLKVPLRWELADRRSSSATADLDLIGA